MTPSSLWISDHRQMAELSVAEAKGVDVYQCLDAVLWDILKPTEGLVLRH